MLRGSPPGHFAGALQIVRPFLVAAIDPAAEQALAGVGNSIVEGRYLRRVRHGSAWGAAELAPGGAGDRYDEPLYRRSGPRHDQ